MKKLVKLVCVVCVMMLPLLLSGSIWAQSGGTLSGNVIDKNEKFPLPTVKIAIVGTNLYGTTDVDGNFGMVNIPPGVYSVTFELSGYLIEIVKNVSIQAGETAELQVALKMGFAHESTVTARREIVSLQRVPQNIEVLTETELKETPILNIYQDNVFP